jgi:hypothetical protein
LFFIETRSKAGVRFVVHARRVGEKGNLASLEAIVAAASCCQDPSMPCLLPTGNALQFR